MPEKQLPLRVICATKCSEEEFFSKTPTGISLKNLENVTPAEVIVHYENKKGLSQLYNLAIEEAKQSPCILVFVHDDVEFLDFFWGERIRAGLQKFDIVGLAGNSRRVPHQPSWFFREIVDENLFKDDQKYLSGTVGHLHEGEESISYYGPVGKKCKLIDGVLIAAQSRTLIESKTNFDEQFSFHFYDMDFCRSAEENSLMLGTIGLSINHASGGSFDSKWLSSYKSYIKKWNN